MPGFVDTHHHQFETALRSFLADGLLFNDGKPHGAINYFEFILGKFAPVYRPQDVYINELFGALSQIDAGVTTVHDISQIHHSPAAFRRRDQGPRRLGAARVFGYFESAGTVPGNQYPEDARRIKTQYFSSDDQLMTMIMGGEIYLPGFEAAWAIGRELGLQVAAHIVGSFGMGPTFDALAATNQFGPDNLFIHMTGMSDMSWQKVKDAGARVSLAVPIEMNMRHGMPPILKTLVHGHRALAERGRGVHPDGGHVHPDAHHHGAAARVREPDGAGAEQPARLCRNCSPRATCCASPRWRARRDLRLDRKIGSLTPGKEADIIILDAEAINVAPLNVVPGAVVSLMERSNVETVIVAGKVRKWKGKLLDVDLRRLRRELEASRDYLFNAAGIPQDLFRPN